MGVEFDYSGMNEQNLRQTIGALQVLQKRVNGAFKAAKDEYLRSHDDTDDAEHVMVDGQPGGTISVQRGGIGQYVVDDPVAYGRFLAEHGIDLGPDMPATRTVDYPQDAAMEPKWLQTLVEAHGGEIPDGVKYRPGRSGGVIVRLDKGVADRPMRIEPLADTIRMLAGQPDER